MTDDTDLTPRELATKGLSVTLTSLRNQARLTQPALARYLCVTTNTYANWESGRTAIPAWAVFALAALYDVSMTQIYGLEAINRRREPEIKTKAAIGPNGPSSLWRKTEQSAYNAVMQARDAGCLLPDTLPVPKLR